MQRGSRILGIGKLFFYLGLSEKKSSIIWLWEEKQKKLWGLTFMLKSQGSNNTNKRSGSGLDI